MRLPRAMDMDSGGRGDAGRDPESQSPGRCGKVIDQRHHPSAAAANAGRADLVANSRCPQILREPRAELPRFPYASAQMSGAPFDAYIRTSPHGRPPESVRPVLSKLYSTKIRPFGLEKFVTTGVISPEVVSSVPKLEVKVRESLPTVT